MEEDVNRSENWDARYAAGRTGWDLGAAALALDRLLSDLPKGSERVLVPGAGFGHDAIAWAKAGRDVVAVDFAAQAVEGMRERAGVHLADIETRGVRRPNLRAVGIDEG
jgi:hypothetical protein